MISDEIIRKSGSHEPSGEEFLQFGNMEKELRIKNDLLLVTSKIISELLEYDNFKGALEQNFQYLGIASGAERIFVYKYDEMKDIVSLLINWDDPDKIQPKQKKYLSGQRIAGSEIFKRLLKRKPFTIHFDGILENNLKEIFESDHIKSSLIIPIFTSGKLWGMIGFSSFSIRKEWKEDESIILQTIAKGIGTSIQRREMIAELNRLKVKAEEKNEIKDIILMNISHEFRTPVWAVNGYLEMLREELDGKITDAGEEILDAIHAANSRLLRTVDDIVSYSMLTANNYTIEFERIPLESLFTGIVEEFSQKLETKNINLVIEQPKEKLFLYCDSGMCRKMIIQIIDNAVKYSESGTITVRSYYPSEREIAVEIEDQGIGISSEKLELIMKPFRQESEGLSRNFEGLGLGLAIIQKFAEKNDAVFNLRSEKGKGTTATLVFPGHHIEGNSSTA